MVVTLVGCGPARGPSSEPNAIRPTQARSGEWERTAPSPLSARTDTTRVWTGEEVLVLGGRRWACPPNADCVGPTEPPFTDGAAYNPATDTWRAVADMPVALDIADAVHVGGEIVVLGRRHQPSAVLAEQVLLRYSVADDTWADGPTVPGVGSSPHLVAAGERVVALPTTDERGDRQPLYALDAGADAWQRIPDDPRSAAFDRSAVWVDPFLYVFDHELVPNPGSDGPTLVRSARFSFDAQTWEQLPTAESLDAPWFVTGDLIVNPSLGGADGGEVNGWGRRYPFGAIYDTSAGRWDDLPDAPGPETSDGSVTGSNVVGAETAYVSAAGGPALDLTTMTWIEVSALPGHRERDERVPTMFGGGTFVFGGVRWPEDGRHEFLNDAWVRRTEPPSAPVPTSDPALTTSTEAPPTEPPSPTTAAPSPEPGPDTPVPPPAVDGIRLTRAQYGCGPFDAGVIRGQVTSTGEAGPVQLVIRVQSTEVGRSPSVELRDASSELEAEVSMTNAIWEQADGMATAELVYARTGTVIATMDVELRLPLGGGCG